MQLKYSWIAFKSAKLGDENVGITGCKEEGRQKGVCIKY